MKLNVSLVKTSCSKPNCKHEDAKLHRHHKRSELLFIKAFARRMREARYRAFCTRYEKFRPRDIVLICECHHREIHEIYYNILGWHINHWGKPVREFSWREATIVMGMSNKACLDWLKHESPGFEPWPQQSPQPSSSATKTKQHRR